ncbi:unnamed protein product [Psylliodes chrysocephalus]|uniref:Uncharacterized protein n=1 Tax=Psylliodes chrysocephalus TaxID=3402493 RepID=A0A9P0DAM7_9CUCU|nr:unnamed protein product [Psylliodes chrysocephala]
MKLEDFFLWPDNSSIYEINHTAPRPHLKDMVKAIVRRGSFNLFYKKKFALNETKELNFLKLKVAKGGFTIPAVILKPRGIKEKRKQAILQNLFPLVPENRRQFWQSIPVNDEAVDLRSQIDDI